MCQETNVTSDYPVWGDAAVTYECRKDSPDNTNITSISGNIFLLYCEKNRVLHRVGFCIYR